MSSEPKNTATNYSEAINLPVSSTLGKQGKFLKVLSFHDLFFLSLGGIIGSGWLFGSALGAAQAGPAVTLSWIIGGVFILFLALIWAEIGGMIPSSGAVVRAPQYAHGYFAGFYFGWAYFISSVTVPPVEAIAVVTYASSYFHSFIKNGSLTPLGDAVSLVIMMSMFLLNYFGIRVFGKFNTGLTWWKLAIPVVTAIIVLLYLYPPNFSAFGGFAPEGFSPVFSAVGTAGILFSFLGFRQALQYSGEARNPSRDVPRAIILSVIVSIILYTLLQFAFVGGLRWNYSNLVPGDWADLASVGVYANAPFYEMMTILGVGFWAAVLLFNAVVSPIGTTGIYTGTSARSIFALSEGKHLPPSASDVHEKYKVPWKAMIVSFAIGAVFLFVFPSWGPLSTVVTSTTVFTYLAGATTLTTLRRTASDMKRSFKVPVAHVFAPIAFVMGSLIVYWTTWPFTAYAFIAVAIGSVIYFWQRAHKSYETGDIRKGIWILVYSIVLVLLSYIGSYGQNYLQFPADFVVVAAVALIFYFWGVRSGHETSELRELKEASRKQEDVVSSEQMYCGKRKKDM